MSGFSGFSLIKTDILKKCRWSTSSHSEHINFCLEVNNYGHIYIIPKCKPTTLADSSHISQIAIEQYKKTAQYQIEIMKKINGIYDASLSSYEK